MCVRSRHAAYVTQESGEARERTILTSKPARVRTACAMITMLMPAQRRGGAPEFCSTQIATHKEAQRVERAHNKHSNALSQTLSNPVCQTFFSSAQFTDDDGRVWKSCRRVAAPSPVTT